MSVTVDSDPRTGIDQKAIDTARGLILDAIVEAGGGHFGAPVALVPAVYTLVTRFLHYDPRNPRWARRDRFILSNGHACMAQYAMLHLTGQGLTLDDLRGLRAKGSRTPGHPEYGHTEGVEATTGPLGQGVANAVGMALGDVVEDRRTGSRLPGRKTWVFAGDGCLMEGVAAEASSLAGQWGLKDLILIYDDNGITIDARTNETFAEDISARYAAYGWDVIEVADGNDLDALAAAYSSAVAATSRPTMIRVRTIAAIGIPTLEDTTAAHGGVLDPAVVGLAKQGWGLDPTATFAVPDDVYVAWQVRRQVPDDTSVRVDPPDLSRLGEILDGIEFPDEPLATRESSSLVLQQLAAGIPTLIGGSADLAGASGTWIEGEPAFGRESSGRNLLFGVREHAMGAIANGLALQGSSRVFTGTFLAFADYMRPAIRLAGLMGLPVTFVFSHDSVALGADGPTHQPVEQLNTLRDLPNLWVVRPADAQEVVEAWRIALTRTDGPTAIVLTRQTVGVDYESPEPRPYPTADLASADVVAAGVRAGAYVHRPESVAGEPELILLATGSEVAVSAAAARVLEDGGIATRVVSLPCWELFAQQDGKYREQVLPSTVRARVAVEAGVRSPWYRWVGEEGRIIGVDGFGACTRGVETWLDRGFTVANIVEQGREAVLSVRSQSK